MFPARSLMASILTRAVIRLEYNVEIAHGDTRLQHIVHRGFAEAIGRIAEFGRPSPELGGTPIAKPNGAVAVANVDRGWQQIPELVRKFSQGRIASVPFEFVLLESVPLEFVPLESVTLESVTRNANDTRQISHGCFTLGQNRTPRHRPQAPEKY